MTPLLAYANSDSGLFTAMFGSHMPNVAKSIAVLKEDYSGGDIFSIRFNRDATLIAIDSDGRKINIWDWRKRRIEKTVDRGTSSVLATTPFQFSPDGRTLASCSEGTGRRINRLWNTSNWSVAKDLLDSYASGCTSISITPNGRNLLRLTNTSGPNHENNFTSLETS